MSNYWENETPTIIKTDKNVLRFYKDAEKLQVSVPDWDCDGVMRQGRTVTLDVKSLRQNADALHVLNEIIDGAV